MPPLDQSFEVFFDLVPTGAVLYAPMFDADGALVDFRFVRLNPAGQRLLGLPAQPPRTFREYYPHSVPTGIFDQYRTAYLTGEASTYDVPYQGDGIDTFFRLVAQRSGELLVVNFTDMADLPGPAVEETLRESQAREQAARAEAEAERQRLYEVLMRMPANIALLRGPDHVYDLVNTEYERLFPARTTLGRTIREVIPEIAGQGFYELFDRVYQTGEPFYTPEAEAWADYAGTGELQCRYYRTSFEPIRNAQGEITEVLNFAVDVTEQVEARRLVEQHHQEAQAARAEAEAERQRFFEVLMQLPAGVVTYRGPDHVYDFVNARYQQMFPSRRLLGLTVREAWPELPVQGIIEKLDRVYATGETYYEPEEVVWLDVTGTGNLERRYYNVLFQPLRDAQGQVDGLLNFAYDVTEQVEARAQLLQFNQELESRVEERTEELAVTNEELTATNEELNESNRQLTRANVDLDTFVYTASHDLKAPIANIESIALALRTTLPAAVQQDAVVARLLDLLRETVARFQLTIVQLTDISRLQQAHAGPAEPVNLAAVVEGVRLDLAADIQAAGTELAVAIAPDLVVSFSPANLRSIIYNLLSNAIKYRALDRPSRVQVRAEHTGKTIELTVEDNGLGMSEAQQRQLFGLFQRLHTHVSGTGVGLYISKRLLENGGGTVAVRSQPNAGTTFQVSFPA